MATAERTVEQTEWVPSLAVADGFAGPAHMFEVRFNRSKAPTAIHELEAMRDTFHELPEVQDYEQARQNVLQLDDELVAASHELDDLTRAAARGETVTDTDRTKVRERLAELRTRRSKAYTRAVAARDAANKAWSKFVPKRKQQLQQQGRQALDAAVRSLATIASPVLDQMEAAAETMQCAEQYTAPSFGALAGELGIPRKAPA